MNRRFVKSLWGAAVFAAAFALLAGFSTREAFANPLEVFGLGTRDISLAGADLGTATDYSAGFANPAGAGLTDTVQFGFGYQYFHPSMKLNNQDMGLGDVSGFSMGIIYPIDFGGGFKSGTGISLYVPEQRVVRIRMLPPYTPRSLQFDNRVHRLVGGFYNAFSWKSVSVGVGVNMFASAGGRGALFKLRTSPGTPDTADTDLILRLKTTVYPSTGIMWKPTDALKVGFFYIRRVQPEIYTATDAKMNMDLGLGITLTGHAGSRLAAANYFTPDTYGFGVEYSPVKNWKILFSLLYLDWSAYEGDVPRITPDIDLYMGSTNFTFDVIINRYNDQKTKYQIIPAGGIEGEIPLGDGFKLLPRFGYRFVSSPLETPSKDVVVLDSVRHVFAAGAGFVIPKNALLPEESIINIGVQGQYMKSGSRHTVEYSPINDVSFSGFVIGGSADVVLQF